jgi:hypothetical protein
MGSIDYAVAKNSNIGCQGQTIRCFTMICFERRLLLYNTIVRHAINSNDSFLKEMIEKTKTFIKNSFEKETLKT